MSSINSNSGFYDNLNSSIIPLDADNSFIGLFTSCLNFSIIDVSVKCDSTYILNIIYSHNSNSEDYTESITVDSVSADTLFYQFAPKMRYYKVQLENTGSNQTELILQTLLKSTLTYNVASGPSSNVVITNPLNGSGYVEVVDMNNNYDVSGNLKISVQNTVDTDVYGLLNNQRQQAQVWAGVLVAQNETSASINPSSTSYINTTLSCYGSSTEAAVIAVEFSNDNTTFYTTQYQYTLPAGDFGFSIACSAYAIRLKLLSSTSSTIVAYINVC